MSTETLMLSATIYLNKLHKCYRKILVLDKQPYEPLRTYTKRIHLPKVSPFKERTCCPSNKYSDGTSQCVWAVLEPQNTSEYLELDSISNLFGFLLSNGYTVNTELTNLMRSSSNGSGSTNKNGLPNLICFITKNSIPS